MNPSLLSQLSFDQLEALAMKELDRRAAPKPPATGVIEILSSFENPQFGRTEWIGGFQHYVACVWRDRVFVGTTRLHPKRRNWMLLISKDGFGVWSSDVGDFSGDPFPLSDAHREALDRGADLIRLHPAVRG